MIPPPHLTFHITQLFSSEVRASYESTRYAYQSPRGVNLEEVAGSPCLKKKVSAGVRDRIRGHGVWIRRIPQKLLLIFLPFYNCFGPGTRREPQGVSFLGGSLGFASHSFGSDTSVEEDDVAVLFIPSLSYLRSGTEPKPEWFLFPPFSSSVLGLTMSEGVPKAVGSVSVTCTIYIIKGKPAHRQNVQRPLSALCTVEIANQLSTTYVLHNIASVLMLLGRGFQSNQSLS